jgi:hypothetical protein
LERTLLSHKRQKCTANNRFVASTQRFSSQWDDDEEEVTTKPTSFYQAGENLKKEEDDEKLNSSGDYDANPSVSCEQTCRDLHFTEKRGNCGL